MVSPPSAVPALVIWGDFSNYNAVAASMFIFWDHCITFGQEVGLIWRSKMSIINSLFYAIRYLTLVIQVACLVANTNYASFMLPSRTACVAWLWFETISGQVLLICVEAVLAIRVFAFYGRSKFLLAFILTLFVAEMAAQFAIVAVTVPSMETVPSPRPSTLDPNACLVLNIPSIFPNLWMPGLIFESFLFLLVAVRFIRTRMQEGISNTPLLAVFVRDGTWAFVLMFAALLWASLTLELRVPKGDVGLTWLYSILALCGTRLILNLREVAVKRGIEITFNATLELVVAQNPALEPSPVAGMTSSAPGTALSATVISAA